MAIILRYFLVLFSILTYAIGYVNLSFDTMLCGVLIFWICNIMYCCENWNKRALFLIFNFVIFVFLISRPTIDMFKESMWWRFTYNSNIFSLQSIYISLIFLWIGNFLGEKIEELSLKNKKTFFNTKKSVYLYNLEIISLCLFYISIIFLFAVEIEKWIYMRGRNYEEIYVSFKSVFPTFFTAAAGMCRYFLCVFLATMPKKSKAFLPLMLYILSAIPYFLIGARSKLVINIIFALVYYLIRDIMQDKEKWLSFFERSVLLIGAPVGIAFLGAYNYIREGKNVTSDGIISLIVDFFYKQGVSFDILRIGYETIPKIQYTGFVNYTFGEIIDYLFYGNIAQILWGAKSLGNGQNDILGLYSNVLANRLAYTGMREKFLQGHGWGSSYLLDTYADWGYAGIVIFSLFLGMVFAYIMHFIKKGSFTCTIALLILTSIYYSPRGSALIWFSFFIYAQCWLSLVLCIICAKLCVKSYSLKNHILVSSVRALK